MGLTENLLGDYNYYRRHTRNMAAVAQRIGLLPPDLAPTPPRLEALRGMAIWTTDQGFDPALWLFTLFTARIWMYPPRFDCLTPKSHIKRYKHSQKLGFFERRQRGNRLAKREAADDVYDPNRDLSASVEAIKLSYQKAGCSEICMDGLHAETLGFHPLSDVCSECPMQQACTIKLKASVAFDIVALRRGTLTVAAAKFQSEQYWRMQLRPQSAGLLAGYTYRP